MKTEKVAEKAGVLSPADAAKLRQLTLPNANPWKMYPRLMFDINAKDMAALLLYTVGFAGSADVARARVGKLWHPKDPDAVIVTLSIRTFFDALLTSLKLPPGSEVVMSAITIPQMVDIMHYHKLVPRAFDIDMVTFKPNIQQCKSLITPKSKMMIVAPLFGRPMQDLLELKSIAKQNNMLFILDGAQCFSIRNIFEEVDADVEMMSFGSIKFSTALGGGLGVVKDPVLRQKVKDAEASLPQRPWTTQVTSLAKYTFMLGVDDPVSFGIVTRILTMLGIHTGELVNQMSRGFPGPDLIKLIRHRPHPAMISLMGRRLAHMDARVAKLRSISAWHILSQLPPYVQCLGAGDPSKPLSSTFWLFSLSVANPQAVYDIFQAHGYDAALGTSQLRSVGDPGTCPSAEEAVKHIVYIPLYPEVGEEERKKLVALFFDIPKALIQSPSARFHSYVASTPLKHAYRSPEVAQLLKDRPQFKEPPAYLVRWFATSLIPLAVAKL
jgi:dTDP-4-amino-4,6-dideoxygalactose transaminase